MTDKVLYQFTLPYPWKKTLLGIYVITIGVYILIILLAWNTFIRLKNPPHWYSFWSSLVEIGVILLIIGLVMRYVLIHLDKIKAPIEVWITEDGYHYRKGNYHTIWRFDNIKRVKVIMDDKKLLIITDYREKIGTQIGWQTGFKRKNELADIDYREFIEKRWMPMMKIILDKIKEYSPGVEVIIEDRRRKYR